MTNTVYNFRDINENIIATQQAGIIGPDAYVGKKLHEVIVYSYDIFKEPSEEREEVFSRTLDKMNPIWYNSLTTEQQTELAVWRQAWLDYPETGVKPDDLSFM